MSRGEEGSAAKKREKKDPAVGSKVEVRWQDGLYEGKVERVVKAGELLIHYDDGEYGFARVGNDGKLRTESSVRVKWQGSMQSGEAQWVDKEGRVLVLYHDKDTGFARMLKDGTLEEFDGKGSCVRIYDGPSGDRVYDGEICFESLYHFYQIRSEDGEDKWARCVRIPDGKGEQALLIDSTDERRAVRHSFDRCSIFCITAVDN